MDRALLYRTRRIATPSTRLGIVALTVVLAVAAGTTWWHASRNDWSSLSPAEREVLAPLVWYWQDISPSERRYYRTLASDEALRAPANRAVVERNLELWHLMTPAERDAARAAFTRFHAIAPDARRALVDRWDAEHAAPSDDPPVTDDATTDDNVSGNASDNASDNASAATDDPPAATKAEPGAAAAAPDGAERAEAPAAPGGHAVIKDAPQTPTIAPVPATATPREPATPARQ